MRSVIAVPAAVLIALYGAWVSLSPAITAVRYRFDAEAWHHGALPLAVNDDREVMDVRLHFNLRLAAPMRWNVRTDGCLLELSANGKRLETATTCGNTVVDVTGLRAGENELLLAVKSGPNHAIDLSPAASDPLRAVLMVAAFLATAACLLLLRRTLHPDLTGTIFAVTFFLGLVLRVVLAMDGAVPMYAFLLSCAAMACVHVTAFGVRHGRGHAYQWAAGLLSALLPPFFAAHPAIELAGAAVVAGMLLWWEQPKTRWWIGVLLMLAAGIAMDATFLSLAAGGLLCLFRRPGLPPFTLLLLFLLTLGVVTALCLTAPTLSVPSSFLLREAIERGMPFVQTEPAARIALIVMLPFALIAMLRAPADAMRAARILMLTGVAVTILIAFLYGPASVSFVALVPAYILLAADGVGRVTLRRAQGDTVSR